MVACLLTDCVMEEDKVMKIANELIKHADIAKQLKERLCLGNGLVFDTLEDYRKEPSLKPFFNRKVYSVLTTLFE